MEAVPPPEELTGEISAPNKNSAKSQAFFGGWAALRNLIWGTPQFLRLWLAQLVTSTGEWVFFLAVSIKAAEVGPGTPEGAVALVLLARLGPGFFFGQLAGVLADRWDRRKLMYICDIARAGVVCVFPFVTHVWQLVLLSLVLEAFTLLWIPAKEALVPNLLPSKHLPTANTLSVLATYGTFPLAVFLLWVFENRSDDGTVAGFFFDAGTFLVSAILIWSIVVPKRDVEKDPARTPIDANKFELKSIFTEMRDGWKLIFGDPTLRAVNIGLAVGLVGGAMLATLGRVYLDEVLLEVESSFALLWGFGVGIVVGVLTLLVVSQRIDRPWVFGRALMLAGTALLLATSVDELGLVVILLGLAGASVGVVYILGFTIIQETTTDEMRGRVFAAFYSVSRVGVLLIVVAAPAMTVLFDRVTELTADGTVNVFGYRLLIPGVRITFWLAALIIIGAGTFAIRTLRGVTNKTGPTELRSVN